MTAPITDAGLAELERLEKAATPGPWRSRKIRYGGHQLESELVCMNGLRAWFGVATTYARDDAERLMSYGSAAEAGDDAAFIVAARNALPSLVHRVRTAEADREWWKAESQAAVAERRTAEARVAELEAERDEALMLTESCSTLKQMASACIIGAAAELRAEKAEAEVARLRVDLEETQDDLREANDQHDACLISLSESEHQMSELRAALASRPAPAQPGQSSALPAEEPRENWPPINLHTGRPCDHSYVRFPSTDNPVCALCGNSHAEIARRALDGESQ